MRRGVLCGISRVCGLEGGLKTGGEDFDYGVFLFLG